MMNELIVFKRKLSSLDKLPLESIEQKHTFCAASSNETSLSSISNSKLIHSLSLLQTNFNVSSEKKSTSTTNHYKYINICPFMSVSQTQLSPRYLFQTSVIFSLSLSLSLSLSISISSVLILLLKFSHLSSSQCARLELRVPRRNVKIYSLYIGRPIRRCREVIF